MYDKDLANKRSIVFRNILLSNIRQENRLNISGHGISDITVFLKRILPKIKNQRVLHVVYQVLYHG